MSEHASTPATPTPLPEAFRQNLSALRNAVFELHKILIESERATYEQTVGTIPSPGYFLQLLTNCIQSRISSYPNMPEIIMPFRSSRFRMRK